MLQSAHRVVRAAFKALVLCIPRLRLPELSRPSSHAGEAAYFRINCFYFISVSFLTVLKLPACILSMYTPLGYRSAFHTT